ncbi:MAG: YigZ family protein [Eggerthella lenta]
MAHVETEDEALAFLEEIRAANRMARHNVYAYVLRGGGAGAGRVRYSDDGEPQKTAGLPTLEVIQHAGLTDVITVVTRYFGGCCWHGRPRARVHAGHAGGHRGGGAGGGVAAWTSKCERRTASTSSSHCVGLRRKCSIPYDDAVTLRLRMLDGTQEPCCSRSPSLNAARSACA